MFGSSALRWPRLGRWPRLALAACCLLLALDSAVTAHAQGSSPGRGSAPVVVAARLLAAGQQVRSGDVRVAHWPRVAVVRGDLRRRADAVGHRVATAVAPGEALSASRLVGRDLTSGMPAGQVAVPVPLGDPRAAELVHAGDRVELYATARAVDGVDPDVDRDVDLDSSNAPATGDGAEVLATGLVVVAVLPGSDAAGSELVVAASRTTALRLTRASGSHSIAAVAEPP
jgi:pilus assembly protein CpaB